MKKVLKKRTGFTLVELLIVIIIIGILAGAMLLVAGSGTDKAEATKIVSDLRSLKAAALMYYADYPSGDLSIASLDKYMDKKLESKGDYLAGPASGDTAWYVGRKISGGSGVAEKLEAIKSDANLYGLSAAPTNDGDSLTGAIPDEPNFQKTDNFVYMRAR